MLIGGVAPTNPENDASAVNDEPLLTNNVVQVKSADDALVRCAESGVLEEAPQIASDMAAKNDIPGFKTTVSEVEASNKNAAVGMPQHEASNTVSEKQTVGSNTRALEHEVTNKIAGVKTPKQEPCISDPTKEKVLGFVCSPKPTLWSVKMMGLLETNLIVYFHSSSYQRVRKLPPQQIKRSKFLRYDIMCSEIFGV